jgi:HAMP domain-containing protein
MFGRTSLRIFLVLSAFLFVISAILCILVGRIVVEQQETALLVSLSSEIQIAATRPEQEAQLVAPRVLRGELPGVFHPESLIAQVPPSGSSVFPCETVAAEKYICSVAKIRDGEWIIRAHERPELWSVIRMFILEISWSLGLLALGALFMAYLLSLFLTRPLSSLSKAAQKISQGEYSALLLPTQRSDEIGELAKAFQSMASGIETREKYLKDAGAKLAHAARLATIGQMGASIAHEVKNPLMAMHGHARLLKQKISDQTLSEMVDVLITESDR